MKLSNIHPVGRYNNAKTEQTVNIKKGRVKDRSVDVLFYIRNGERVFISDYEFKADWKEVKPQYKGAI